MERGVDMDQAEFIRRFDERIGELDLNFLAQDVEQFLFASEHQERVATFRNYWLKRNRGRYLWSLLHSIAKGDLLVMDENAKALGHKHNLTWYMG